MAKRKSTAAQVKKQSVSITFDKQPIIDALRRFENEINEKALIPAVAESARIIGAEMKIRAPKKSGKLRDSIYRYHDTANSTESKKIYLIGPNKNKAPHWHWLEYGNARIPAQSYIRSAWEAKKNIAMKSGLRRLSELVKEIINA